MQIDKVTVYQVLLPFAFDFSHSLRKRSSAKNIIVEVVANNGEIKGYGESAPRTYVTGESQESATNNLCDFIKYDDFPWDLEDVSLIRDFVDHLPNGKEYNTAVCAIEMALLDALGKSQNRYIIEYFPKEFYTDSIYYGAAFPLSGKKSVLEICRLVKKLKIYKLKLKMGKDYEQNKAIIETVVAVFGDSCDLKVDINCAWDFELALKHIPLLKKHNVKVIEQPMPPGDPEIYPFARMMQAAGMVLMADESACVLTDMENILKNSSYRMINVRLSKCGGLRRSLKIIDFLRDNGLAFQIGCQLGESGLLSAAGRVLSLLCGDAVYFDGSYDEFLLKENITIENVSFGPEGMAGPLSGPGLGVKVNSQTLDCLSHKSTTKTILRP